MTRKILIVVTILAALAAVPILYAQHHGGRMGGHGGPGGHGGGDFELGPLGHLLRAKEQLGLSDAQVTQLKDIFTALREQNEPYRDQMRDAHGSIIKILLANPNDTAAATAIIDQQQANERVMKLNALSAASKALNVLTPEQRAKALELFNEHMSHMQGGNWGH